MAKHRKHIRRWPKLTAIAVALSAFLTAAVLPVAGANANTPAPQPTCTETECVWLMTESPEAYDWMAMPKASAIWIDMQSQAAPWLEPVHMRAQLRDASQGLLIYFSGASTNAGIGSLTIFRVNAEYVDPPDSFTFEQSYVTNVTLEQPENGGGIFVRIRQIFDQNMPAPQPEAGSTQAVSPTPTPTMDALPTPTPSPEPVVTPAPEVAPSVTPTTSPEVSVQVAPVVVAEPVRTATPVATSEPAATSEPVQIFESREDKQEVLAVGPEQQPPAPTAPPAQPARVLVPAPEPATRLATEPETVTLAPTVQEPAMAGVGVMPPKTESSIPAWAAAGVATTAATLAAIGGVQLFRKRGVRIFSKLRAATRRQTGKLRVS